MNRHAVTATAAVLALGAGFGLARVSAEEPPRETEVARTVLKDFDKASDLAEMPGTDPCTLLFGEELAKDFGIKDPGNGKSVKDVTFKSRTCKFNNGLKITLWQEPLYSTAVYREQRDFGRVYITQRTADVTGLLAGANEGALYYDGKLFYEGLFRIDGTTVSIMQCNNGMEVEQFEKVAARVIDRLTGY